MVERSGRLVGPARGGNGRGTFLGLRLGGWAWVSCRRVAGSDRDGTRPTEADGEGDERGAHGQQSAPSGLDSSSFIDGWGCGSDPSHPDRPTRTGDRLKPQSFARPTVVTQSIS